MKLIITIMALLFISNVSIAGPHQQWNCKGDTEHKITIYNKLLECQKDIICRNEFNDLFQRTTIHTDNGAKIIGVHTPEELDKEFDAILSNMVYHITRLCKT